MKPVDTATQARQRTSSQDEASPTWLSSLMKDLQERHISEVVSKIMARLHTKAICNIHQEMDKLCSESKTNP